MEMRSVENAECGEFRVYKYIKEKDIKLYTCIKIVLKNNI